MLYLFSAVSFEFYSVDKCADRFRVQVGVVHSRKVTCFRMFTGVLISVGDVSKCRCLLTQRCL